MRWLLLLWVLPALAQDEALDNLAFHLAEDGRLHLALKRDFLELEEVHRQLNSGLTTTFSVHMTARARKGPNQRGFCRIDIRYEPWDRIYFVSMLQHDGSMTQSTLSDYEALVTWFAAGPAVPARLRPVDIAWVLDVTIDILPFSQREAERTQRWFHEHLGNPSNDKDDANKVLDLLVTSSIRRKPLIRYAFHHEVWP